MAGWCGTSPPAVSGGSRGRRPERAVPAAPPAAEHDPEHAAPPVPGRGPGVDPQPGGDRPRARLDDAAAAAQRPGRPDGVHDPAPGGDAGQQRGGPARLPARRRPAGGRHGAAERPGMSDLAGAADENPFPASIDVKVRSVADVGAVAGSVGTNAPVDPILPTSYNPGASDRIQKALLIVGIAGAAFLLLLGFVAVTVTANSIRTTIMARESEVAIMQLVGARRWMVRGPFVVEGAMTGGVAGLAAGLVTLVAGVAVVAAGRGTFAQIAPGVDAQVCALAAGLVLVTGLLLGSAASLYSVHRQLES
ncbi:MAG: FtsX-like permease family protein [Chloroflexi bacterium]|nr:MAG: FtsX-like permease family protein [Chloroflexota bacterium]